MEGTVEISVSLGPERVLFWIFFRWLSLGYGKLLSQRKGCWGPGYLCLSFKAQQYFRCPWGCRAAKQGTSRQNTYEHPEVLLEEGGGLFLSWVRPMFSDWWGISHERVRVPTRADQVETRAFWLIDGTNRCGRTA